MTVRPELQRHHGADRGGSGGGSAAGRAAAWHQADVGPGPGSDVQRACGTSGSGALGLEALSRGAAYVQFVESDPRAAAVLRRNVDELGLAGTQVSTADVFAVLRRKPEQAYDLVLADPPYALDDVTLRDVLSALASGGWLAQAALVVVERSAKALEPIWPDGVSALTHRRYGDTAVYYGCAA